MKSFATGTLLALVLALVAGAVQAGIIRNACIRGERPGNPNLCACIQIAADRTLTRGDQRVAAKFFRDPDRAQQVRQSKRRADSVFWERYKNFGAYAASICK